ncbi:N-acetyltransferase [Virgisporangium aliadipatigenens]|uniref:N-acetyltransferase n=1 Tax=Virgisporangium aliadipatigenens TaxID=741659 RepID=A0A8J3YSQ8_9ACTN|nr:GNAT family N-acetyltransferase [Virgisporangium aliadipatigenens]GIJ49792.1 N-acetyltransferase [Virgisporangium aliadipatigenens]
MTSYTITPAQPAAAGTVARRIAKAFCGLEVAEWLVPNDEELREATLTAQFRMFVEQAFTYGEVSTALAGRGASVWMYRDQPLPPIEDYDERLKVICGPHVDRFRALDEAFAKHHPDEPHHHLAFLAVEVSVRGGGVGSALLEHHLRQLDEDEMPAYLEASDTRSRELYLRYGFRDHGPRLTLPDRGPVMFPMWRDPEPLAAV